MSDDLPTPAALRALLDRAGAPGAGADDVEAARRAAGALFAAHRDRVYWLCLRIVGRPELAAELTQETMVTAWSRLPGYRGEGTFYAWLHAIARFTCLHARERKRDVLGAEWLFDPEDPTHGALAAMRRHERDALLEEACRAALDPIEQEALVMRFQLGMGVDEITALLRLTDASGARGLLQGCKRKLRRELERRLAGLGHGSSLVLGSIGTET